MKARQLTDHDAATIRTQFWTRARTQTALAKRYRVSQCAIHKIVYGVTYANAGGPLSQTQNPTRSLSNEQHPKHYD